VISRDISEAIFATFLMQMVQRGIKLNNIPYTLEVERQNLIIIKPIIPFA
jgi:hypothetical protein